MKRGVGCEMFCFKSCMRCHSQTVSLVASVEATYSALVDDWEMELCNLDDQEMGPPVSKNMAPDTDHCVSGSMAYLESV